MEADKWAQIITTLIITIPTFWTFLSQSKKDKISEEQTNVDNAQKITVQAMSMLGPVTERVSLLETQRNDDKIEIDDLKLELADTREELQTHKIALAKQLKRIKTLETGIEKLIKQIKDAGYEPVFVIPEGD